MKPVERILQHFSTAAQTRELLSKIHEERVVSVKGTFGTLRSVLLACLFESQSQQVTYFCLKKEEAEEVKEDLEQLLGSDKVTYFPESLFSDQGFGHVNHNVLKERLSTLESLSVGKRSIVVSDASALLADLPDPGYYSVKKIVVTVGESLDFESLVVDLVELGFVREQRVEHHGEMCVRGGLIDIFPYSSEYPYRIEFWDDEVESIRLFEPDSQRSLEQVESIAIFPQEEDLSSNVDGSSSSAAGASLLKYLPDNALLVLDEPDLIFKSLRERLGESDGNEDANEDLQSNVLVVQKALQGFQQLIFVALGGRASGTIDFGAKAPVSFGGKLKNLRLALEKLAVTGLNGQVAPPHVYYSCDNESQVERLENIFSDEEIVFPCLNITALNFHKGFVFPAGNVIVYTDHEFYGRARRLRLPQKRFKGLTPRELKHLNVGDYVVHVDFGVGIFRGLKKISVHSHERECLQIEYRDRDTVYVRIERMDRVNKYSSKNGASPNLSKLGSLEWRKAKDRTKKKIKDIARDLIRIYAKRKSEPGFAFSEDTLWQRELEVSFPFEDTPDQMTATVEVKKDMENAKPMDRLICGDVGFGKTEVAVRAAFKAVLSGKQVAVLVPTTILAYQHFNTFRERLANFPVQVEMLSRFRTKAEQREIVGKLKTGEVDIVIGTHRLLSKDIEFKDLGLLIVDEEHRFGVTHKEKLKRFRVTVDVLTLTATPIPRTLQFSLLGARDMTHITTPPRNRLPIITEILPFNSQYIREVIMRELDRGGQTFFVHNRVRSINRVAKMVSELVPEADIAVAHGQLSEKELETVMVEFVNKQYQILISTLIIESGLDMPNVNTIIMNRADKLGLAQLYQLRGRVGRSHRRAYAYFIIPPIERLTEDSLKRLRAIEEFSEIGSGSQLAMRDLEIRGAGNLLGAEQTGFIDTLGFDLYNKILEEAVLELKEEQLPEKEQKVMIETQVEMDFDAFLPESYLSSGPDRVDIYRRLTDTHQFFDVDEIEAELRDRFGRVPQATENLLYFVKVRLQGVQIGLAQISIDHDEMVALFAQEVLDAQAEHFKEWLGSMVANAAHTFEFFQDKQLGLRLPIPSDETGKVKFVSDFLTSLIPEGSAKREKIKGEVF